MLSVSSRYRTRQPRHHRNCRDSILRRTLDQLVADSEINQGIALLVEHPVDVGALKKIDVRAEYTSSPSVSVASRRLSDRPGDSD